MKVAWVTGGGTGIGRALAEQLYTRGDFVLITGRRAEVLDATVKDISAKPGGRIICLAGDVADSSHVQDAANLVASKLGPIDLLINNAGSNPHHPASTTPLQEYSQNFDANCLGAIACTQAVLPGMRKRGRGSVVMISSILGKFASGKSGAYSVSKYAMTGFTDSLRQELVGSGVNVLGVYPGLIHTDLTRPFVEPGSLRGRMGKTPDDIARVILRAVDRGCRELYYPWYVRWTIALHRLLPALADRLADRVRN